MIEKEVEIKNLLGFHGRASSLFVKTAEQFKSQIFIKKNKEKINAKSIMNILTLGIQKKEKIKIYADGEDEKEAIKALTSLIERKFGEE